jgi:hypothetical protein
MRIGWLVGPEHPLVAQLLRRSRGLRLVLAGIGFHLGAIQGHVPQAHHAGLLAQPQDLNKQTFEGIQVPRRKSLIRLWSGC